MNFVRARLSIGSILGQRCRLVTQTWKTRGMCNKPQEVKAEPPAVPAEAPRPAFRLPGLNPSEFDKKVLIWSGRFKTPDQIPKIVSHEMIDAARNKVRVKVCYLMMVVTIGACLIMVILGKRAAGRHESLITQNLERKARWQQELVKKQEAAAVLSEKGQ